MKTNKKMMMLSFIGIIIVVLGHTGNQIKLMNDIFPYYSFHMVLFIFISGYFYKPENEKNIWGRKGYIFKRIKKMVIPYFIWNLIYGIIINIFKVAKIIPYGDSINLNSLFIKPWITGHQFVLNIASWFLLALFLVNIVYILIRKITSKIKIWNDYIAIFVFFIISIISIYLSNKNLSQNYIPIMRTGFFIFFYHLGYIYKTKIEGKFKINTIVYLLLIITIQLIVFKVDGNISYIVAFMKFDNKFIITPIIVSITGVLFWLKISEILEPALGKSKIVNYISNHTFDIMLHHLFIVFVVNVCIYKISDVFGLNGFDVQKFKNTIYYYYTAGVKQLPILYTIIAIIIPLSIRYICEQIKLKIVNKESLYMKYDYLIVGSGLFGSIFAYEANKRGKKCLVIDKRPNVAGNIYTENVDGINIHKYGAHIFHTNNKEVWQYINQFAEFNRYTNSPVARYKDELYNMPFNMNTFNKLWGVFTPEEAKNKIEQE